MKEYASDQSRTLAANLGAAVQILETIRFILFREDSFTRGQSQISMTGHWRIRSCMYYVYTIIQLLHSSRQKKQVFKNWST